MKRFCRQLAELSLWKAVWILFVFLLPLTSVPVIVKLVRSDVVAAPSALVLLILLIGWAIPRLISGKHLSANASPFVLFVLIALLTTAVSFFRTIPDFKAQSPFKSSLSAILTLFVGLSFYLVSLLWHDDRKKLALTFRILNISGAVICLWTLTQAFYWYRDNRYPEWMKTIQFSLSVGNLYRQRFVGFTLEPSWLAHQLNLLYLPFWFAASVTGYSAFRFRLGFITAERILFLTGTAVLFLTLSRVGLGAFLITAAFCALVFVNRLIRSLTAKAGPDKRGILTVLAFFGVLLALAAVGFGILYLLAKLDFRMAGLFDLQLTNRPDAVFYFAEKLSLAARFVYWDGGFSIFSRYPLFGVGLGHAGFYLPQFLNDYAFRLTEVRNLLYRSQTLLNIKSLWIRILAETGIAGFTFFFIWYLHSLLGNFRFLKDPDPMKAASAWMGCFALLAFILEGFSLDTFALPYIWFSVGLAVGSRDIAS